MPGVKGKSGRKPNNPNVANTRYLRIRSWQLLDDELARLKRDNPAHYARITNSDGPGVLSPQYMASLERSANEQKLFLLHRGRDRANQNAAKNARGARRLRMDAKESSFAELLVTQAVAMYRAGKTICNIAMILTRRAGKAISTKAVSKLLRDLKEIPDRHSP